MLIINSLKQSKNKVRTFATIKDNFYSPHSIKNTSNANNNNRSFEKQYLKLKSGQLFEGVSFGAKKEVSGEAVFTTSPVGYPESMTDPSFKGQILVFTQPLIGNYGAPKFEKDQHNLLKYYESDRIQVEGIVVSDYAYEYSHWNAIQSLADWCKDFNIPAISNVDTRMIVKLLRDQGSTLASLQFNKQEEKEFIDPNLRNLVSEVSTKESYTLGEGDIHIAVIDCGIKYNILRSLLDQNVKLTVLPWNTDLKQVIHNFDGLFLSNGPGNPNHCIELIDNLKWTIDHFDKPIFGICMGNQLLGKSIGLDVYKMKFGNRGHNQPVINEINKSCFITSQNHGYALNDKILPLGWNKYFYNANDLSNEGLIHNNLPISSVQFHPEAKGGPMDTYYLFNDFINQVKQFKYSNLNHNSNHSKQQAYA